MHIQFTAGNGYVKEMTQLVTTDKICETNTREAMLTSLLFNEYGLHLYIGKDSTESIT